MKPLRIVSLAALLISTFSVSASHSPRALATDDTAAIEAERPGFTNGTATVEPGHIQFETGVAFTRDGDTRDNRINDGAQVRFPLNVRSEVRLGLPAYSRQRGGGTRASGFDDVSISYKNRFVEGRKKRPSLAVIAATTLPTGARNIGARRLQPQLALEAQGDFTRDGDLSWNADIVYTRASGGAGTFGETSGGLTLNYALDGQRGFFAEVYRVSSQDIVDSNNNFFDGGVTYLLNNDTQFDLSAGRGFRRSDHNYFVAFGIAHRY